MDQVLEVHRYPEDDTDQQDNFQIIEDGTRLPSHTHPPMKPTFDQSFDQDAQ